jgi:hypothetical protein
MAAHAVAQVGTAPSLGCGLSLPPGLCQSLLWTAATVGAFVSAPHLKSTLLTIPQHA